MSETIYSLEVIMKIAVLSDIHEDFNRSRTGENILAIVEKWIKSNSPEVFILSGDMTTRPKTALVLLNQLQKNCSGTKLLYVHGNHDVYHDDSTEAYNILLEFPGNLGNGSVQLTNDWVIIGDGGWYDYSLGLKTYTEEEYVKGSFGGFTWPDKTHANWPRSDKDETERYARNLEIQLQENQAKNIIMVTHFMPFAHFLQHKNKPSWDFFHSMMGSEKFGELAVKYGVKKYIFGHIHTRYQENYQGIEVICNPLGYYPYEWSDDSAEEEILSTIKTIEI